MEKDKCKHEFTHIVNQEEMLNQYKSRWVASRVTVYCKKCGKVTLDEIRNNSAI